MLCISFSKVYILKVERVGCIVDWFADITWNLLKCSLFINYDQVHDFSLMFALHCPLGKSLSSIYHTSFSLV